MKQKRAFERLILFLLVAVALVATVQSCSAQPTQRLKLTQLEKSTTVEGTKAGQIGLTNAAGDQRYAQYTEVQTTPINYVPTPTGNLSNISEFVEDSLSRIWYIDWQGNAVMLNTPDATCDQDWLRISDNGCPEALTDSLYKYKYASIGARLVWPGAELLVSDSIAPAVQVLSGNRNARLGFRDNVNGTEAMLDFGGSSVTQYLESRALQGNYLIATSTGTANQPFIETRHFGVNSNDSTVQLFQYPNTRDDGTTPLNFLSTAVNGKIESHPISSIGGPSNPYLVQNSAPTDTAAIWIDNSTGPLQFWPVKSKGPNGWFTMSYYDPVARWMSKEKPIVIIGTGQSNMGGTRSTFSGTKNATTTGDTVSDQRILKWDAVNNNWERWNKFSEWASNSISDPAWAFAKNHVRETGNVVRVFHFAFGGRSISGWQPDSILIDSIINNVLQAGSPQVDAILWHQGEADHNGSGVTTGFTGNTIKADSAYNVKFRAMYREFGSQSWWNEGRPFIAGGLVQKPLSASNTRQSFYNRLQANDPQFPYPGVLVAESIGLGSYDNIHFEGTAYDSIGRRYYALFKGRVKSNDIRDIQEFDLNGNSTPNSYYLQRTLLPGSKFGIGNYVFAEGGATNCTSCDYNILLGPRAGAALTNQDRNVMIGRDAGYLTTTNYNVIVGDLAASSNTTGEGLVILGALHNPVAWGSSSIGIGFALLPTTGTNNIVMGQAAGAMTGAGNVLIGTNNGGAGSGGNNVLIGTQAGQAATGSANVAVGPSTLVNNAFTGSDNVAVGRNCGTNVTTGNQNILAGYFTAGGVTTGNDNVILGTQCGNVIGSQNIVLGSQSANASANGNNVISIGQGAMSGTTTVYSNNIAIGQRALDSLAFANVIGIGNNVNATAANQIIIGEGSFTELRTGAETVTLGNGIRIITGAGTPEAAITAPVGSMYLRSNGGAGTSMYIKESGTGNTGWVAK